MNPATSEKFGEYKTNVILNTLSEGICQIDLNGKITYSNKSANNLIGWNLAQAELTYLEAFFGKNKSDISDEETWNPIQFVLESGETSHVTSETFIKADGSELRVEYICVPLMDESEISGAVISFQDVAERFEVNRALEEARELAVHAAETKANFLANMSHEIRTPLNGIIGTVGLLFDSHLNKEQENYLEMLDSSISLLRVIVDDILDFSKIEAGAVELEKIKFSPVEVAAETIKFFSTTLGDKKLDISVEVEKGVDLYLRGDPGRLRQVLNNLISNAIKFTSHGFVTLSLKVASETETEQRLRFEVADSGIGISEETIANLFSPFIQADSSTARVYGGTGLGLAICRQLAELANGDIGCESVVGEGSIFWLEIPFGKIIKREESDAQGSVDSPERNAKTKSVKNLNVLVVEDNRINQLIADRLLSSLGLNVTTVDGGGEAIEAISDADFDCVFMDCQMPGIDGFDATRRIREMKGDSIRIFALSASTSEVEKAKSREAGMDEYISKPFTKADLSATLLRYFKDEFGVNGLGNKNNVKHSLANIIESSRLESFLQIEESGKKDFTRQILEMFFEHSEPLIDGLKTDIEQKDLDRALEKAHSLKGSAGNVGFMKLYSDLENLEEMIRRNPNNNFDAEVSGLRNEFERARKLVNEK